jgi:TRAP-type C4-dicarboxylate transport system permease small subunit
VAPLLIPNEIDTTLAPGAPAATGGTETCALVALGNSLVDAVVAIALGAEVLIVFAGIITRSFFGHALLWTGEVSQIALATIGFVGGAAAYRDSHHAFLHVLLHRMRPGLQRAVAVGTEWIVVFTAGIIAWASVMLLHENYTDVMPLLRISAMWASLPLTIGMLLVVIYALQRLLSHGIRLALLIGAGLGGVVLAVLLTKGSWLSGFTGIAPLYADLITFIVSILIGLPVGLVMPLSAMMYLFTSGNMMIALPENMIDALTGFVLLALPFFVFAGTIMDQPAHHPLRADVGRPCPRWPATGAGAEHVSGLGALWRKGGRRRRGRQRHARRSPQRRIRRRGRRRNSRRLCRHGRNDTAQHRHAGTRLYHLGVHRRSVRRRPDACGRGVPVHHVAHLRPGTSLRSRVHAPCVALGNGHRWHRRRASHDHARHHDRRHPRGDWYAH